MVNRDSKYIWFILVVQLACLFGLSFPARAEDDVAIRLSLDRDKIGQEEVATLSVEVSSHSRQDLPKPTLAPLPQFDIYSLGTSRQFVQDNSGLKVTNLYNYALSPKKTGTFNIHPAWMVVDGERFESNSLQINVVANAQEASGPLGKVSVDDRGQQKDLFVTTEIDKKTAYIDQQVTLTLKFFRATNINMLSTPSLSRLVAPDFWTNDIPPQKEYNQVINGQEYHINEIRWALYPTKTGKLTIDGARITVAIPDRAKRRTRDPFSILDDMFTQGKNVTIKSGQITVQVDPLPSAGKPGNFSGAVGEYRISAEVDRTDVEVNESITLTVKISGRGNVKSIPDPTLPDMDGFRVEKSSSDFKTATIGNELGGTKTFEYLLIPRIPGNQKIESLSLNYFNPDKKQYQTTQSKPIRLTVRQGELQAASEIPYNPISGQTINLQETDIRYIKTGDTNLTRVNSMVLTSPVFLAVVTIPLLALAGGIVDIRRKRKLAGDVAYARLRKAKSIARKRLKQAEALMNKNDSAFYAELSGVIYQFIADKSNQSAQGLTTEDVERLLSERNSTDELRQEIKDVIQQADFGRFAGSNASENDKKDLYDRSERIISRLEETL